MPVSENINSKIQLLAAGEPVVEDLDPCDPDPCGPYSQKREVNGVCVCSCLQGHVGSPPNCRPECLVSSECSPSLACVSMKCVDPCPGSCGPNAICKVVNHNPTCQCPQGFTGDPDPFRGCKLSKSLNFCQNLMHAKIIIIFRQDGCEMATIIHSHVPTKVEKL